MDPFAFMYETDSDRQDFGAAFCGPATLTHGEDVLVARYPQDGGDGYTVEVYCCAMPARFYEVRALPTPNSVGEARPGFTLSTGSGMGAWAAETARQIAQGMVGVRNP